MNKLLQDFRKHWTAVFHRLQDKPFLLAVSGGADSMALAHLFAACNIPFAVAHCNFGLRGEEADKDEQLVKDWCEQLSVVCHTIRFETSKHAEEWKKGTQETARILRYKWFDTLRKEHEYLRIVTAHHANDNVETLLINLFKGTGIKGLHGIVPDNGEIIRPLLFAHRDAIREYVAENNIVFREDASNSSDDYLRNAVRHHLIPAATKLFPGAVNSVNESITRFAEAEQIFNAGIEAERKKLIEKRGQDYYIPVLKLRQRQPLATICYELLSPFGFASAQLPDILQLLSPGSGRYLVSATHRLIRNRDFLIITALESADADLIEIPELPFTVCTDRHQFQFTLGKVSESISDDANIAFIDLSAVVFPLVLRKWRTGDYLYPLGMGMKKKKVGRLLIDKKVPIHEKEHLRILECNKRVVWVSGIRLDERFKVRPATTSIMVVKMVPIAKTVRFKSDLF